MVCCFDAACSACRETDKWEPMISGSGIPQVEGEILGKLNQNWLKVLPLSLREDFFVCSADCLLAGKVRLYSLE